MILPWFLEEYGEACTGKLAKLARKSGVVPKETDDSMAARQFITWIREMNAAMNIPEKQSGINEKDIPMMAGFADHEANPLYPVPVLMDTAALEKMYYKIME